MFHINPYSLEFRTGDADIAAKLVPTENNVPDSQSSFERKTSQSERGWTQEQVHLTDCPCTTDFDEI